jgi:hypothetical protein
MLGRFSPPARRTIVRAGLLASGTGRETLGTDCLLWALAEESFLDVTPEAVRDEIGGPQEGELLATLGIDLAEVRRRAFGSTGLHANDPDLWRLQRSRALPLRVTLVGPGVRIRLDEGGRKVVEVALRPTTTRCSGACSPTARTHRSASSGDSTSISATCGRACTARPDGAGVSGA